MAIKNRVFNTLFFPILVHYCKTIWEHVIYTWKKRNIEKKLNIKSKIFFLILSFHIHILECQKLKYQIKVIVVTYYMIFVQKKTPKTYQITIILRVISHHMSKISWHIGSGNCFNAQNFHIGLTKNIRSISLTGRMDSLIKCSQNDLA